ncbi:MAG: GxxExxY protein, partial [Calditrichia bacterium]|nr:GxxExxY protein [Calditrichia bacterium]
KIIGAAQEVHKILGNGFLEAVYHEALEIEFSEQNIPYQSEKELPINYKKKILNKKYKVDFLCFDKIIVEIKALSKITSDNEAQLLNYLKASELKVGLLINFGEKSLNVKRMVL